MQSAYQLVRVFDKPNVAKGSQAAVFLASTPIPLDNKELIRLSADIYKDKGIATTCFTSELTSGQYEVQCFNDKKAIQCCGHGMIAAAKNIFIKNNLSEIIINQYVLASHRIDETGKDVIELSLPRLMARLQTVPGWVKELITFENEKILPAKVAVSEKDDGYILLEFDPVLPLEVFHMMKVDLKLICDNTKRAVVVVQFDQENNYLYMRYFAPQYGMAEDIATGSVMRFVGDYIEQNYNCAQFDVNQCSSLGGYMKIDCKIKNVVITANASMESG